ncbi:MAG: NAD(P)-dependent oxidoreductase, partial [Stenotrophomonas sp.]|nr:NAD(P)-dependent oxidoreductase [Stenotrophomonas sp.]
NMAAFRLRVRGRLINNMGTHSPDYSHALEGEIIEAGGQFVEAPVSGSAGVAREGRLVAMLAGRPASVALAKRIIEPMCGELIEIGTVPSAMRMKLAVNLYLIASVTALAEATHFADVSGLDLRQFGQIVAGGPLGSPVVSAKLEKMTRREFSAQAAVRDVVKNAELIAAAVDSLAIPAPLLRESLTRFMDMREGGCAAEDMAAVLKSYERSPGESP